MSGFPSLEPAFTVHLTFDAPYQVGALNSGPQLHVAPISGGTVKSEASFSGPPIDAEIVQGTDHVLIDPSMQFVRVNVKAVLKNNDGSFIHYVYNGILKQTPASLAILMGSADAKTTEHGDVFTHVEFQTGAEHLKSLETSKFVGSSRFIVGPGKPPVVEAKISKVVYKA